MTTEQWTPVTPLVDDQEQVSYWVAFKVGDRVRLTPSGECPHHSSLSLALRGELGAVVEIQSNEENHPFKVQIDRPELLPEPWMADFGPWCAAGELELLA